MLIYLTRRIQGVKDEALDANKNFEEARHALSVQARSVGATLNPNGNSFFLGDTQYLIAPYKLDKGETADAAVEKWNAYEPTYRRNKKPRIAATFQQLVGDVAA